jgi:hypothetical protein
MIPDLVLQQLGLDSDFGQLLLEALGLNAQLLTFQLADLDLLLKQHGALHGHVMFRLHVLERRRRVAGLALKVIVGHLAVPQLQLESAVCVTQHCDFLFEAILRHVGLVLGFSVLSL